MWCSVGEVQTSRMRPSGVEMYGAARADGIGWPSLGGGNCVRETGLPARASASAGGG